jgi:hypothetical protein
MICKNYFSAELKKKNLYRRIREKFISHLALRFHSFFGQENERVNVEKYIPKEVQPN